MNQMRMLFKNSNRIQMQIHNLDPNTNKNMNFLVFESIRSIVIISVDKKGMAVQARRKQETNHKLAIKSHEFIQV